MIKLIKYFLLTLCPSLALANIDSWVVYYSDKAPASAFSTYDLIVFDDQYHPPLEPLKQDSDKVILGYLSLGEVEKRNPLFKEAKAEGLLYGENKNWPDSYFVNMRNPKWLKMVVEQAIPSILKQGFDGIFIDTIDNAEYMESVDPKQYAGMKAAAVMLITLIRSNYPHIKIMINRGFAILPEVAPYIDYVLAESLMTDINFKDKTYYMRTHEVYEQTVKPLRALKAINPKLQLFSLDYWIPK